MTTNSNQDKESVHPTNKKYKKANKFEEFIMETNTFSENMESP